MKSIKESKEVKIVIKKSIFIANTFYVDSKENYLEALKNIKTKYKDASHNCYAVKISKQNIERSSDDGEPSGTAGKVILKTINDNELDNVIIIVTRYFGGKQLGFGGLVHAYKDTALEAINNSTIVTLENFLILTIAIYQEDYHYQIIKILESNKINILSKSFSEYLTLEVAIKNLSEVEFLNSLPQNSNRILQKREELLHQNN